MLSCCTRTYWLLLLQVIWENVDSICNNITAATASAIDSYLTNTLDVPPVSAYAEFNSVYTSMQQRAADAIVEREEAKAAKQGDAKVAKLSKAKKMLEQLTALIDPAFRGFATKHSECTSFKRDGSSSAGQCINLEVDFINDLLKPYIVAPSKMKKKIMSDVAGTINSKLQMIAEKNLVEMEFLSDTDPFEKELKQYIRDQLPNVEAVYTVSRKESYEKGIYKNTRLDNRFFTLLEEGKCFDAIVYLIGLRKDVGQVLLAVEPSASVSNTATDYDDETVQNIADVAWSVCIEKEMPPSWRVDPEEAKAKKEEPLKVRYGKAFTASQEMFASVFAALGEYDEWLLEKYPDEEDRRAYQRNNAVQKGWGAERSLEQTLKKDFDELDKASEYRWNRRVQQQQAAAQRGA